VLSVLREVEVVVLSPAEDHRKNLSDLYLSERTPIIPIPLETMAWYVYGMSNSHSAETQEYD